MSKMLFFGFGIFEHAQKPKHILRLNARFLTLWNDASKEARRLKMELEETGYTISDKFTGSATPTTHFGRDYFNGYEKIRILLVADNIIS